jgi:hypothetical protein
MKRGWAVVVGFTWSWIAVDACVLYTPIPDDPAAEAGVDATTPPPAPSEAGASSSSGFVVQPVPTWAPSFKNDGGTGIDAVVMDTCPALPATGGTMSGTYRYTAGCFGKLAFAAPFAGYCAGIHVIDDHAAARIDGVITDNGNNTVTRTGTVWLAAEFFAPCRHLLNPDNTCPDLAGTVKSILAQSRPNTTVKCYDQSETDCICQMEDVGAVDTNPMAVDKVAGQWGSDFLYGVQGSTLTYTGKPKTGAGAFTIEPAFRWALVTP